MIATTDFARIGPWLAAEVELDRAWEPHTNGIGWLRDGQIVAAVAFERYVPKVDVQLHCAGRFPRRAFAETFIHVFHTLGCRRATGLVSSKNRRALDFDLHLGFRLEGIVRRAGLDGSDIYVLGMLREECRFIHAPWTRVLEGVIA